ncbi:NADH-quinone oxidoreductase subunit H [Patescibacteria group bacterium]|nr:NADH-quinone oxidoreductase subunit H [Patescibacteria group bacterium]
MSIILFIFQALLIPGLSPLIVGIIRKIKARFQNRQGASIFQPYRDLWKLFHKDEVISETASWIFRYTPYLLFAVTIVISAGIPMISTMATFSPLGDFLLFVYLIALGTFFLALAGLDTGSVFGGTGSSREMTVAALTEGGLIFSLFSVALLAKTANISEMVNAISVVPFSMLAPVVIAFIAFYIALLAECARYPFDNPATHLELTMIHEAMILEYSGKRLALVEWAAANKLLIFISLGTSIFFPWGIAQNVEIVPVAIALILFLIKILVMAVSIAVLESTIAKLRFFRLPDLLLTSLVLGMIAIIITVI